MTKGEKVSLQHENRTYYGTIRSVINNVFEIAVSDWYEGEKIFVRNENELVKIGAKN